MSSFTRTIQRTVEKNRDDDGNISIKSKRAHYAGRGSRLGYQNPKDPCRVSGAKKRPKPWRAPHKVDPADLKPGVPKSHPQPLAPKPGKAAQREAHRQRMDLRARQREASRLEIADWSARRAEAARKAMARHKGKR